MPGIPIHPDPVRELLDRLISEPADPPPLGPSVRELLERPALSPADAARVIGCSRMHVYNLVTRGELAAHKVGTLTRIPTRQVLALMGVDDGPS